MSESANAPANQYGSCAHTKITVEKFGEDGYIRAERWYCLGCGMEFVPLIVQRHFLLTYIRTRLTYVKNRVLAMLGV
jgi:hypothetical protein